MRPNKSRANTTGSRAKNGLGNLGAIRLRSDTRSFPPNRLWCRSWLSLDVHNLDVSVQRLAARPHLGGFAGILQGSFPGGGEPDLTRPGVLGVKLGPNCLPQLPARQFPAHPG